MTPRRLRPLLVISLALPCAGPQALATNLEIQLAGVEPATDATPAIAQIDLQWQNAWRNDRNHDAAWVFLRLERPGRDPHPAPIDPNAAHQVEPAHHPTAGEIICPPDGAGVFVQPAEDCRGDVSWTLHLALDPSIPPAALQSDNWKLAAHAIEMVYIPAGPFTLGDPGSAALDYASFYRADASGEPAGLYRVADESAIEVAPTAGALYYKHSDRFSQYEGDRKGPVPAEFPKGTRAFYIMKREITQGQYAAFLNTLGQYPTGHRAPIGHRDYTANRGTIQLENGAYIAAKPDRPANYISWDDGCAFADWSGLRPMTELEFTKACRGPGEPIENEYPWNTASKADLRRVMGDDGDLTMASPADERQLTESNRHHFGASYYWVLDLAGSAWERCVTIGHPNGRSFEGSHGDARLTTLGGATNPDWPKGDDDGGGFGYRGGGHYALSRVYEPGHFNPHSPIAWRRFGSWGAAPRHVAYGFRCVRTAPE